MGSVVGWCLVVGTFRDVPREERSSQWDPCAWPWSRPAVPALSCITKRNTAHQHARAVRLRPVAAEIQTEGRPVP
jgi:hypothetical protein